MLKVVAVPVQKTNAKGLQKSGTGVVGGAAADANQETPAALADGVKDQFSDTVGGSAEWIAFRSSQERKSS